MPTKFIISRWSKLNNFFYCTILVLLFYFDFFQSFETIYLTILEITTYEPYGMVTFCAISYSNSTVCPNGIDHTIWSVALPISNAGLLFIRKHFRFKPILMLRCVCLVCPWYFGQIYLAFLKLHLHTYVQFFH